MDIISWNVNGVRACVKKGFAAWLESKGDVIVGLQEVRARYRDIPKAVREPVGWATHFFEGEKAGYSGTGLYSRWVPDEVITSIGEEQFDREGRAQIARFGDLWLVNVYFPNGGRDLARVPYKLAFYERLLATLRPMLDAGAPVIVMGDYNTAHHPIDLARPTQNIHSTGFLPIERDMFQVWLDAGFADTFRDEHPEREGAYSWWAYRGGARERNVGWRIDYVLASPAAQPFIKRAYISAYTMGSDHCPVGVEVDEAIFGSAPPTRVSPEQHVGQDQPSLL